MKKLLLLFAVATMTVSAQAQTVTESKTFDNFYVGINGGVATKAKGHAWLKGLNPNAGLRVGRWFTPVFGLAVESNAYFSNKPYKSTGTAFRFLNTSLLGTVNFTNWFGGYPGEPRTFEVVGLYGLGWGHLFGTPEDFYYSYGYDNYLYHQKQITHRNNLTSKAALDFVFNLGEKKAWQFYVEPSITWGMNDVVYDGEYPLAELGHSSVQYNLNRAYVQLNAGLIYKFKNSNGTHNFTVAQLRNQAEIDGLNAEINRLRNELAQKPKEIIKEVEVIKEVAGKDVVREVKVEDLVFVTFAQGKSELTADARKALAVIQPGKHVQIVGTASPEGNPELNQKLSQARADAVAEYLLTRGVAVDEATGKGVQGTTSNRLAVVYVK
ncbi:MAG: OmpA family protein [Prevotella sp.]|nr:OmpA family protein [Prevotella sp.]MBR6493772.1 OmpA family protein [Prevotella sp.]